MEDVLDYLREHNQPVPVPLELPEEEGLVEIEEQILIGLPHEFREYLLLASDVVYGSLEPVTASDPNSHTYLPEVASVAWDIGVPRHLIPLCEDQGRYYCVEQDGEVVLWEDGEISEERWETVWYWIRDVWLES